MITVTQGNSPIILAMPHTGTELPDSVWANLNDRGKRRADTDWHIDQIYSGLMDDVTIVHTDIHRYAIDVNRAPEDESLYPGQNTTGLCPVTDFDGLPIYLEGQEPGPEEIETRKLRWHAPYHEKLSTEISRIRQKHGIAILYDCHSIRSDIPYLFDGILPDFNIGTNQSTSCAAQVEKTVDKICRSADGFTSILNGRFRGGWTTRHYGRPQEGVHAIQMELAQSTYMQEAPPWRIDTARADRLRTHLFSILRALQGLAETGVLK